MTSYICVDVGNSRISYGLFSCGQLDRVGHKPVADPEAAALEIAACADALDSPLMAISSVVPKATGVLIDLLTSHGLEVFELSPTRQSLISDTYQGMGSDRIANLVAAHVLYAKGERPAIVIDCGTATTLSAVDRNGRFAGGFITLGLGQTLRALSQSTDQLPDLAQSLSTHSEPGLAFNTSNAIISGTVLAQLGAIELWIARAKEKTGRDSIVIATGGHCLYLAARSSLFDLVDPNLTLQGIRVTAEAAVAQGDRG